MPKILVVDDDADVREMLSLRLGTLGCETVTAVSGVSAREEAKRAKPDLIFLDIELGAENGLEVLKSLKQETRDNIQQIPVVMLTGHASWEQICLEAGASGYLAKPFGAPALKAVLSRFFKI